jgi:hypothetical protein
MQSTAREVSQAKRAARRAQVVQTVRILDERAQKLARMESREERKRSYGNAVRDISRDASRRGVISNKPLKVNVGGYVISTAPQTQPLTREQLLREYY